MSFYRSMILKLFSELKEFYTVPGAGHGDLYDRTAAKLAPFFKTNLK